MTADLLARAQAGDADAFGQLVDPHRRELQVHCYRILGSASDAEDALQDTLLAAWQGLASFEGRASVRTWLYRIATTRCLNALRSARRRPQMNAPPPGLDPPEPTRLGEVLWLEPYPDILLEGLADPAPGPEARYEASESISLAFITALQMLPPRQRAVLILRDVLGFHASEVAHMLDTTRGVSDQRAQARPRGPAAPPAVRAAGTAPAAGSAAEQDSWTGSPGPTKPPTWTAWSPSSPRTSGDHAADTAGVPGPRTRRPVPHRAAFRPGWTARLIPTRANGQPAFGIYARTRRPASLHGRAAGPHPFGQPDLRHDPLRRQRPAPLRTPATLPE